MKKEFVNYEIALALKELGFNEPCLAVYQNPDFLLIHNLLYSGWDKDEMISVTNHKYASNGFVTAPLYQQAFRWFREKHDIKSYILPQLVNDIEKYTFKLVNNKVDLKFLVYDTYKEAEIECLKKLIKIVSNN